MASSEGGAVKEERAFKLANKKPMKWGEKSSEKVLFH